MQSRLPKRQGGPNDHNGPVDLFDPAIWADLNGADMDKAYQRLYFSDDN